jgi:Asp-tRNA(Asn)/Glu-tRNA(Gln) amidotransferase A subunit family amidase
MTAMIGDLERLPAWRVLELYRTKELKPTEYVERCLERIERLQPKLNAFITVMGELAMDDATRAEERLCGGEDGLCLAGLPVAVKDEVWTKGVRTTAGSAAWRDFVPDVDATVVHWIRDEGAAIIGKTNLPEYAAHPRCWNPVWGDTRNPYDVRRVPGSSSGGSAVAVATGMAPLAIGSDGAGSTRIPSAHCGIVGLHPTRGIVSSHGVLTRSATSSLGPMARTVRDVALLLDVIAGFDPLDTSGNTAEPARPFLDGIEQGVSGMRMAWTADLGHLKLPDKRPMLQAYDAAVALAAVGAKIEEPDLVLDYTFDLLIQISMGSTQYGDRPITYLQREEAVERLLACDPEQISPNLRESRSQITPERYGAAKQRLARLQSQLDAAFEQFDVILSPTMAEYAPLIPDEWIPDIYRLGDRGTSYLGLINLTDSCAASVPCGFVDGMPVGIQVMGPPHAEAEVLKVCESLEQVPADRLSEPMDRMWGSL